MKKMNLNEIKKFLGVEENLTTHKGTITPEKANLLLKRCNKNNRRLNKAHVETLKRDMESGNWYNDTSYIGFDGNGTLVNGQHRLKALAESNVESVVLKFDFDSEQHISMDTGMNRTYASTASISKKMGLEVMPANFKTIIMAGLKLTNPKIKLSNSELVNYWSKYKEQINICNDNKLFDLGKINSASVKASILWAYLSGVDIQSLSHFAEVLRNGITKSDFDIPIIRLRDELVDMKGSSGNAVELRRAQYTQYAIYAVTDLKTTSNRLPATNRLQLYYNDIEF